MGASWVLPSVTSSTGHSVHSMSQMFNSILNEALIKGILGATAAIGNILQL